MIRICHFMKIIRDEVQDFTRYLNKVRVFTPTKYDADS